MLTKSESVLEVAHLSVAFDETSVLRDLTFTVAKGATLAVIGPNGAGKTVLLRALIGAVPSTGTIRWAPHTRLGYVPQKLDLQRDLPLTGVDLLEAKADVCHSAPGDVSESLQTVGLSREAARRTIGKLSGGEFQRLLLALALMGSPTTLLFDEPTSGLDEPGTHAVYEILRQLQRERQMALILISHELSVVYEHADQVLCLSHERTFLGAPADVLTSDILSQAFGSRVRFHDHEHGH